MVCVRTNHLDAQPISVTHVVAVAFIQWPSLHKFSNCGNTKRTVPNNYGKLVGWWNHVGTPSEGKIQQASLIHPLEPRKARNKMIVWAGDQSLSEFQKKCIATLENSSRLTLPFKSGDDAPCSALASTTTTQRSTRTHTTLSDLCSIYPWQHVYLAEALEYIYIYRHFSCAFLTRKRDNTLGL